MRKIVLYQLLSLDGVAEEPSDWATPADDKLIDNLRRVIDTQETVLLGRGTYDYWVGYWPTSDFQPFAGFINGTPKHVFTSSEPTDVWENTTLVDGPAEEHVRKLKEQDGGDVGIHGSITLAQSLLRAELVDELQLVISPTVAGSGRRLFPDDTGLQAFTLEALDQTSTGSILATYRKG